ncbi:hypothetical protein SCLCIDRAFT_32223 [Scleroderma citrinum Foug A]|uniref:FAD-binding domain-containing protein n=1 Tax=Scleroderma citrinum Foug A TaxID=1036808 RepID=A0A0C3DA69_9AGAM|nr:hypothetical protein SCLCIDRAFT_32223 [Scleroderma citrinum Foug A]
MATDSPQQPPTYDVIIVGGSVAGCATALSIFNTHPSASILVLDDADPSLFKIGESLPAPAKRVLGRICPEIFERISTSHNGEESAYMICSGTASVWGRPELQETYAMMNPYGVGWHLDRALFDELFRQCMCTVAQGSVSLVKSTFVDIDRVDGNSAWLVSVNGGGRSDGQVYRSKWVVDASGRKATVARKLGSKTVKEDSLLAFYAVFVAPSVAEDTDNRTLIEACESGWWYSSPLPSNHRVVVYHTDDSEPTSRDARKLDGFMNLLNNTTVHISQAISKHDYDLCVDPKARFPICTTACSARLEPPCQTVSDGGARWCAVGDAAMAFDPLSSQGMITALKSGVVVGDAIAKALTATDPKDDPTGIIPHIYSQIWNKYLNEKAYFYGQEGRFEGKFWETRR